MRLEDGAYVDTTDERLVQVHVPKPRSEGADLASMGLGGGGGAAGGAGSYPPPAAAAPPPPPPAAAAPVAAAPPPAAAARVAAAAPPPSLPQPVPGYQPGLREITDAAKMAKSATSALQFEDVSTAVKLLTEALALLTQPRR